MFRRFESSLFYKAIASSDRYNSENRPLLVAFLSVHFYERRFSINDFVVATKKETRFLICYQHINAIFKEDLCYLIRVI